METIEHKNIRFMAKYKRYEPLIHDHTSMKLAKKCLRQYFYQIVLGKRPREDAIHLAWGRAYHKFREVLEVSTGDLVAASRAGLEIWGKKQGSDPVLGTKWDFMTEGRLLKSFGAAFKHWQAEKQMGRFEVLMTEQPFNVALKDGSHTSGRFDQVVRWNGKVWGRDFKTTSKEGAFYARQLDPNDQFARYTFAESKLTGERVQGQIIETMYNTKKEGPTIGQYVSSRSEWQLNQWEQDQIFMNQILEKCREEDIWPMQEESCQYCPFHSVCKEPSENAMMAQLDREYITKPWDNTKVDD